MAKVEPALGNRIVSPCAGAMPLYSPATLPGEWGKLAFMPA